MVSSFGALKLCELCPVKGTLLASYYAIGTYLVYWYIGRPTDLGFSVASRYSGASPEFTEILPEIVNLGDHLGCSGYCPHSRDSYNTKRMSSGG